MTKFKIKDNIVLTDFVLKSDRMDEFYSQKFDPWDHQSEHAGRKETLRPIFEKFNLTPTSVMDIGCALGMTYYNLVEFIPNEFTYVGLDISSEAIKQFKEYFARNGYRGKDEIYPDVHDIEKQLFYPACDLVLLIDVMYYWKHDWRPAAENALKSVKPEGYLFVSDTIIRFQYRDYYKTHPECELVGEWRTFRRAKLGKNIYAKSRLYRRKDGIA